MADSLYDPRRPEIRVDPYPALACLRAENPVHWSDVLGAWVLTRYADVRPILSDPRFSADRITPFIAHAASRAEPGRDELARLVGLWAVFTDPPVHTRLRGLMAKAFTPRAVERLRARVQAIIDALLDRVVARGEMEVIRDLASPLPVTVIGELLGVPAADHDRLKAWSDELATFVGSALLGAREREDALSEDELVATCVLLLFAGHETTTNLIGNGLLALRRCPAALAAWRAAVPDA